MVNVLYGMLIQVFVLAAAREFLYPSLNIEAFTRTVAVSRSTVPQLSNSLGFNELNPTCWNLRLKKSNIILAQRRIDLFKFLCSNSSTSDLNGHEDKGTKKNQPRRKYDTTKFITPPAIPSSKKKYPKGGIVSRLRQAAIQVAAERIDLLVTNGTSKLEITPSPFKSASGEKDKPKVVSLSKFSATIDRKLSIASQSYSIDGFLAPTATIGGGKHLLRTLHRPARDSMSAVVLHNFKTEINQKQQAEQQKRQLYATKSTVPSLITAAVTTIATKHVAIIFAKPLFGDQLTIESVIRIRRLVQYMQSSGNFENDSVTNSNDGGVHTPYKPHLIIFVGGKFGSNVLNDCDVCYDFFLSECLKSPSVSLKNVTFHLEPSYVQDGAIDKICSFIQQQHVPKWVDEISSSMMPLNPEITESMSTICSHPLAFNQIRFKIGIHFTLVSSDHHLCIVNDIHVRSPNQSPLKSFETKRWNTNTIQDRNKIFNNRYGHLAVETCWTYLYATTATIPMLDPLQAFAGRCYKYAQALIPVVLNLRGVVGNSEFFQQENYRVLVTARRNLVRDMEELYKIQPSLQAVQRRIPNQVSGKDNTYVPPRLDVVLENALLSMGRCLDLVRPAGLLTGSVQIHDFKIALRILEEAVQQITATCDPDRCYTNNTIS